jgi:hypothetical protein
LLLSVSPYFHDEREEPRGGSEKSGGEEDEHEYERKSQEEAALSDVGDAMTTD